MASVLSISANLLHPDGVLSVYIYRTSIAHVYWIDHSPWTLIYDVIFFSTTVIIMVVISTSDFFNRFL